VKARETSHKRKLIPTKSVTAGVKLNTGYKTCYYLNFVERWYNYLLGKKKDLLNKRDDREMLRA
jgi:hypothetical protein